MKNTEKIIQSFHTKQTTSLNEIYPEHYKTEIFKYVFENGMVKTLTDLAQICEKESKVIKQSLKESITENYKTQLQKDLIKLEKSNKILQEAAKKVFDTGLV